MRSYTGTSFRFNGDKKVNEGRSSMTITSVLLFLGTIHYWQFTVLRPTVTVTERPQKLESKTQFRRSFVKLIIYVIFYIRVQRFI